MPNFVPGKGPFNAKLFICGEAPGQQEDEQGIPFVGATGQLLDEILQLVGIRRNEVYLTNVCKYRPPQNEFSMLHLIGVDLQEQIDKLWNEEIRLIKPNCILALGNEALNALTGYDGILTYRGSILHGKDGVQKIVPTIHPAALFSREEEGGLPYVYKQLIAHDIKRAYEQSKYSGFNLPDRRLDIATNSLDTFRFFQEYKSLDKAEVDIENINCIPVCVGFSFNKHHAISIPLLKQVGKVEIFQGSESDLIDNWRQVDEQLKRLKLMGQNFKYDDYKLGLLGFNCKTVHSDTLLKAHLVFPELPDKSLHVLSSLWTEEPYYKSEGKEFKLGKQDISQLFKYNGRDCCIQYEVDDALEVDLLKMSDKYKIDLIDFYYNYIMKKHKFYLHMENVGFRVDDTKKKELKIRYTKMQRVVHSRLTEQIGYNVNVKSYPQVFSLLYKEMKFKPLKKAPTSEDSIVRLLGNHCKGKDAKEKAAILEDILEERRIRDQISRQINFMPDYDGRCKTSYKITGTETARTSTNNLKKPIRPKKIGLAFHTISKHGRLAKDIRSMLIPDEGKVLIQADASQAEARIVAVLSSDFELLKAFDTIDIHRRTAGLIYAMTKELVLSQVHIPIVDDMDKDDPMRFGGKFTRHASNYDMGKGRFMTEFNTLAQKNDMTTRISEWRAGQMIEMFHAASPKVRGVFHKEIQNILDNTRTLINPFGRPRTFFARYDDSLFKEGYAHLPQSTVADLVQSAAIKIDEEFNGDANVYFVSESHDSLVIQAPINDYERYARVMKKHMETPIDFSKYCSIKRDYILTIPPSLEIAENNYGDFRKLKL